MKHCLGSLDMSGLCVCKSIHCLYKLPCFFHGDSRVGSFKQTFHLKLQYVCAKAYTYMALDTIPETMIHRPNPQVGFIHAERPFDEPKIMVVGKDFFIWKLCIGHISLDSVPCGVLLKSFKVDAYGRLALNTEVLVVATIVYVFLETLPEATFS